MTTPDAACWCCGEPTPIRGEGDPWEGRLDGYCASCANTRCDTTDSTCAVKRSAAQVPAARAGAARKARERATLSRLALLADFALWMSSTWEAENADDRDAARQWAAHYLEGGDRG